jgi:hypothetical protein
MTVVRYDRRLVYEKEETLFIYLRLESTFERKEAQRSFCTPRMFRKCAFVNSGSDVSEETSSGLI